jgi:Gas vesicle protein
MLTKRRRERQSATSLACGISWQHATKFAVMCNFRGCATNPRLWLCATSSASPTHRARIDVFDRMLDEAVVIDASVRMSLIGIDLVTVEARIVSRHISHNP